jgi:antirestriction protein ArdC
LVAEIGSAFLCAGLGITPDVREDHPTGIGEWLYGPKNDKRAVVHGRIAGHKTVDFLQGLQDGQPKYLKSALLPFNSSGSRR